MILEIVTKSELGVNEEFEEIYDTLEENSKLKAEKLREYCSFAVLADDTGLFVNALNGEPGGAICKICRRTWK